MTTVLFDFNADDRSRRQFLYRGSLLGYSPRPSSLALVEFVGDLIREPFGVLDSRDARHSLKVEEYVAVLPQPERNVITRAAPKDLVHGILAEKDCDSAKTYFDLPRLRTAIAASISTT